MGFSRDRTTDVNVLVELMPLLPELPPSALLTAYPSGDWWLVWTRSQATDVLRSMVNAYGGRPEDYAFHSGCIGGATRMAARVSLLAQFNERVVGKAMPLCFM